MIKILHIAMPIGGVGTYIQLLTKYVQTEMFNTVLLCNKDDKIPIIKNASGEKIATYYIPLQREINPIKDIQCMMDMIKKIKQIQPDVLHCHSAKAGIFRKISRNLSCYSYFIYSTRLFLFKRCF